MENEKNQFHKGLLELFQHCPIFHSVHRDELEKLAKNANIFYFSKGEVIIQEGEVVTSFYVIKEGRVKVYKTSLSGRELTVDIRKKHEAVAESAFLGGAPYFCSVKALEDTSLVAIGTKDFKFFLAYNPLVSLKIIEIVRETLERAYEKLVDMASGTAAERLFKSLYVLYSKYGNNVPFTHQEIADMSGSTKETATRVFTELKNSGIISLKRGMVIITDQDKLHALRKGSPLI